MIVEVTQKNGKVILEITAQDSNEELLLNIWKGQIDSKLDIPFDNLQVELKGQGIKGTWY